LERALDQPSTGGDALLQAGIALARAFRGGATVACGDVGKRREDVAAGVGLSAGGDGEMALAGFLVGFEVEVLACAHAEWDWCCRDGEICTVLKQKLCYGERLARWLGSRRSYI